MLCYQLFKVHVAYTSLYSSSLLSSCLHVTKSRKLFVSVILCSVHTVWLCKNIRKLYKIAAVWTQVFSQTSMAELRKKSKLLTAYMEHLLVTRWRYGQRSDQKPTTDTVNRPYVKIITPSDPDQRGSQLSIWVSVHVGLVFKELEFRGVVVIYATANEADAIAYMFHRCFFVCFVFFRPSQKYQTTVLRNGWTDFHETFTKR